MQIVYIPGVWDLLHIGHVAILEKAKTLGDKLIVGVASNQAVICDKGKAPIICETDREKMLQALSCVDLAVTYPDLDFIPHLSTFKPNILMVGSTWGNQDRHKEAEKWVIENKRRFIKLPYTERESTTLIKERIRND